MTDKTSPQTARKAATRRLSYQFTPYPSCLVYHPLLGRDERELLLLIMLRGDLGCSFDERTFVKRLEIGPKQFRRARARLMTLKLIRVSRLARGRFLHVFEKDLTQWRLTRDLFERLKKDAVALNEPIPEFAHPPFESLGHFEATFAKAFPKHEAGRIGRGKPKIQELKVEEPTNESTQHEAVPTEDSLEKNPDWKLRERFENKKFNLTSLHPLRIMADYFHESTNIDLVRCGEIESLFEEQVEYLRELEKRYLAIMMKPREEIASVAAKVIEKVNAGTKHSEIAAYIDRIFMAARAKRTLPQPEGGNNEV